MTLIKIFNSYVDTDEISFLSDLITSRIENHIEFYFCLKNNPEKFNFFADKNNLDDIKELEYEYHKTKGYLDIRSKYY